MSVEWKPVRGYEGFYEVSELGVRSIKQPGSRHLGKVLKIGLRSGYPSVRLCVNSVQQHKRVHRVLAEAFIPNPENKPSINHKDGNRLNFNLSNLEWCTHQENVDHAYNTGLSRRAEPKPPKKAKIPKPIKVKIPKILKVKPVKMARVPKVDIKKEPKFNASFKDQVIGEYPSMSITEISRKYSVSTPTVRQWLKDCNKYIPPVRVKKEPKKINFWEPDYYFFHKWFNGELKTV